MLPRYCLLLARIERLPLILAPRRVRWILNYDILAICEQSTGMARCTSAKCRAIILLHFQLFRLT